MSGMNEEEKDPCSNHDKKDCVWVRIRERSGKTNHFWFRPEDAGAKIKELIEKGNLIIELKPANIHAIKELLPDYVKEYIKRKNPAWKDEIYYSGQKHGYRLRSHSESKFDVFRIGKIAYYINAKNVPDNMGEKIDTTYTLLEKYAPYDIRIDVVFVGKYHFSMLKGAHTVLSKVDGATKYGRAAVHIYGNALNKKMFMYNIAALMAKRVENDDIEFMKNYGKYTWYLESGKEEEAEKIYKDKNLAQYEDCYPSSNKSLTEEDEDIMMILGL